MHIFAEFFGKYGFEPEGYLAEGNSLSTRFGDYLQKMDEYYTRTGKAAKRVVTDYVAGMTDDFALECVNEIMVPRRFGNDFDVE